MKVNIMSYIEQLRFINVCADIWTTRGMTASFLGLTAHFFFLQRSQATQCVRTMPSPHTADNIAKLVKQYLQNGIYLNPKFIACLLIMEKKKQQCSSDCEVCDDSEEEEQNEVETPEEEDDNLPVDIQEYGPRNPT